MADTNILGYLVRNTSEALHQRMLRAMQAQDVGLSAVTRAETQYGLALLRADDKRRISVGLLLNEFPALPWTSKAADIYGEIAATLQRTGQTIGVLDTMIAAHALAEDLILITHNTRHFERVPDLKLKDWMA